MKHRFLFAAVAGFLAIIGATVHAQTPTTNGQGVSCQSAQCQDGPAPQILDQSVMTNLRAAAARASSTQPQPPTSCQQFPADPLCNVTSATPNSIPCVTNGCGPLTYHNGPVQEKPQVYVLFWGPKWGIGPGGKEDPYVDVLNSFYWGLGDETGAHSDTWSTTSSQYTDSAGSPTFAKSLTGGRFSFDSSTPPKGCDQGCLGNEAAAYAQQQLIPTSQYHNVNIVVLTQEGTCPQGFAGNLAGCPSGSGQYCATHSYAIVPGNGTSYDLPYDNVPYMPDSSRCAPGTEPATYEVDAGHELAETFTDPLLNAWYNNSGGEMADECPGSKSITLNTETITMQSLYSNAAGCTYSSGRSGAVKVVVNGTTACLDNANDSLAPGNKIQIWACNDRDSQNWVHYQDGTLRTQGRCLDDTGNGGINTKQQLWACNGLPQQSWSWSGSGSYNPYVNSNGLCLDDTSGQATNSNPVQISTCNGNPQQQWSKPGN